MSRGCEGRPRRKIEIEKKKLDQCPKRLFLDQPGDIAEVFWYYQNYKRGLLPVDGGLLDQPALLMECFAVIDGAVATIEAEEARKLREQADKNK